MKHLKKKFLGRPTPTGMYNNTFRLSRANQLRLNSRLYALNIKTQDYLVELIRADVDDFDKANGTTVVVLTETGTAC